MVLWDIIFIDRKLIIIVYDDLCYNNGENCVYFNYNFE